MVTLEEEILDKFGCKTIKQLPNLSTSGCVNVGHVYLLDNERKIFLKKNKDPISDIMFKGEHHSLEAILSTNTIKVPKSFGTIIDPMTNLNVILMEYIDNLSNLKNYDEKLGENLGNLHRDNYIKLRKLEKARSWIKEQPIAVEEFGFDEITCCGKLPQINDLNPNWIEFYARNKLDPQIRMILEDYNDKVLIEEWNKLHLKIDKLFLNTNDELIELFPSLLHGDLWIGNAGETKDEPVIYDPASFYGHSEYDLAISYIFKGFSKKFYDSYFKVMKKVDGFEVRQDLYQLFHYLNHWNHFGHSYRSQSIELIKYHLYIKKERYLA